MRNLNKANKTLWSAARHFTYLFIVKSSSHSNRSKHTFNAFMGYNVRNMRDRNGVKYSATKKIIIEWKKSIFNRIVHHIHAQLHIVRDETAVIKNANFSSVFYSHFNSISLNANLYRRDKASG